MLLQTKTQPKNAKKKRKRPPTKVKIPLCAFFSYAKRTYERIHTAVFLGLAHSKRHSIGTRNYWILVLSVSLCTLSSFLVCMCAKRRHSENTDTTDRVLLIWADRMPNLRQRHFIEVVVVVVNSASEMKWNRLLRTNSSVSFYHSE